MATDDAGPDAVRWTLVVPLKAAQEGKSRLSWWLAPGPRTALVRAIVADTLAAAAAAESVERIVVVTADAETSRRARRAAVGVTVTVIDEPVPPSLNRALRAGVERARQDSPGHGVAVLLGDLPALRPAHLDAALADAARHALAMVVDAEGTGTTLLTATPGVPLVPAFGSGSAQAHRAHGHVPLSLPPGSGLSHDVDVPDDIAAVIALGVGVHTARALRSLPAPPRR